MKNLKMLYIILLSINISSIWTMEEDSEGNSGIGHSSRWVQVGKKKKNRKTEKYEIEPDIELGTKTANKITIPDDIIIDVANKLIEKFGINKANDVIPNIDTKIINSLRIWSHEYDKVAQAILTLSQEDASKNDKILALKILAEPMGFIFQDCLEQQEIKIEKTKMRVFNFLLAAIAFGSIESLFLTGVFLGYFLEQCHFI